MTIRGNRLLRWLFRLPNALYDHGLGWLLTGRMMRLTHVGRRSGREYHTVLEVVYADPASGEIAVVVGFGRSTDWFRNLQAHPALLVETGRRRFVPVHRQLEEGEAFGVIADYEHRNRAIRPLVHQGLSWLAGWRYDGTDQARRRLVHELPIIALGPVGETPLPH